MTAGVSMRMFMLMHLVRPFSCRVHQRPENQSDDSRNRYDNRFWDFITPQYRKTGKTDRRGGKIRDRAHAEHDDRARDGAGGRRRRAVDEGFELRIVAMALEPGRGHDGEEIDRQENADRRHDRAGEARSEE